MSAVAVTVEGARLIEELQWALAALEVTRVALEKSISGDISDCAQAIEVIDAVLHEKSISSVADTSRKHLHAVAASAMISEALNAEDR